MIPHIRYAWYLARHKFFVLVAGRALGVPLWRLIIHDWSKFTRAEWGPYVTFFYGRGKSKAWDLAPAQDAFDAAWLHHQHHNPHHWQHWILRQDSEPTKVLEMPEHFAREMVADWMGAGRAITGKWDVASWWEANLFKIVLHDNTRRLVESLIG